MSELFRGEKNRFVQVIPSTAGSAFVLWKILQNNGGRVRREGVGERAGGRGLGGEGGTPHHIYEQKQQPNLSNTAVLKQKQKTNKQKNKKKQTNKNARKKVGHASTVSSLKFRRGHHVTDT